MTDKKALACLVGRAADGDEQAFEQIYNEKIRSVLFRVKQIIGDREEAEDIAQEVMLAAYQQIGNLRDPEHFNAWLHSVIVNKSNSLLRKKYIKRQRVLMLEDIQEMESENRAEFLPREFAEDREKKQALMEEIEKLPAKRRMAVMLFYFEGMNTAEIAGLTGTSISNVTSSIAKAKASLIKNLENRFGQVKTGEAAMSAAVIGAVFEEYLYNLYPENHINTMLGTLKLDIAATNAITALPKSAGSKIKIATWRSAAMGAVAVAGIAVCGLVATLKAPTGEAVIPYPDFSPVVRESAVPQSSDTPEPAGEKSGISADSEWHIKGTLIYLDHGGMEIQDAGLSLDGYTLELSLPDGQTIAMTESGQDGAFDFGKLSLDSSGYYYVDVITPRENSLLETASITGKRVTYDANAAAGSIDMVVGVIIRRTPDFMLRTVNGDCPCGHVNPERIILEEQHVRLQSASWIIFDAQGAAYRKSGVADSNNSSLDLLHQTLAEMLAAGADGLYTICVEITDVFGNTTEKRIDVVIDTGEITPNQYS